MPTGTCGAHRLSFLRICGDFPNLFEALRCEFRILVILFGNSELDYRSCIWNILNHLRHLELDLRGVKISVGGLIWSCFAFLVWFWKGFVAVIYSTNVDSLICCLDLNSVVENPVTALISLCFDGLVRFWSPLAVFFNSTAFVFGFLVVAMWISLFSWTVRSCSLFGLLLLCASNWFWLHFLTWLKVNHRLGGQNIFLNGKKKYSLILKLLQTY